MFSELSLTLIKSEFDAFLPLSRNLNLLIGPAAESFGVGA